MKNVQCFRCHIPTTNSERIVKTVDFFLKHVKLPSTSSRNSATKAARDLIYAITDPTHSSQTLQIGDETVHVLERLATIFATNLKPTIAIVPIQPRVDHIPILQAPAKQTTSIISPQPMVDLPKILQEPPPKPITKSSIRNILIPNNKVGILPPPNYLERIFHHAFTMHQNTIQK